ncbi:uncharacterized protein [Epargyreus clarus]|uniref:uncharacterized protein n=1 Tax=Epargyreus clarus TaxID=520877 RepID=UPI003C2E0C76
MSKQEVLHRYSQSITLLKKESTDAGISEDEFQKLYFDSLKSHNITAERNPQRRYTKYFTIVLITLTVLCMVYNYKAIYSYLICNLQEYIYPGLRLIRKLSIPFISLFPALTELYQEPCLIQNPFFTVVDMDCWPCSSINNVRQAKNPQPTNQQQSAPFIYETEQSAIKMHTLRQIYMQNKEIFDNEAPKILTNNKFHTTPQDLFENIHIDDKNLYIWKSTNFNVARILRQVIPRPKVVPKFGQSTERFIIIDSSQSSFHVPDTECNFSFLLSLSGARTVQLRPAEECKHQCKSLKVELKESHLLWYNWWYWRPVVQSSSGNNTFIAHVGSYC